MFFRSFFPCNVITTFGFIFLPVHFCGFIFSLWHISDRHTLDLFSTWHKLLYLLLFHDRYRLLSFYKMLCTSRQKCILFLRGWVNYFFKISFILLKITLPHFQNLLISITVVLFFFNIRVYFNHPPINCVIIAFSNFFCFDDGNLYDVLTITVPTILCEPLSRRLPSKNAR